MTELIFTNTPKVKAKVHLGFCRAYQGDANFWVGIYNMSVLQHSILNLHTNQKYYYYYYCIITNDTLQEII